MDLKIWGKTIMSVQKYLERVTRAIDSVIYKKALASGYVSTKNLTDQSSFAVSNFIINMSQRKVNLINLNTICFNALKVIDKFNAKLLILKHIDGLTSAEIASLIGVSNRTYFRKINKAYDAFAEWLENNKLTEKYFCDKYKDEGWIMEVFYGFKEDAYKQNDVVFNTNFLQDILRKINKQVV